jgi:hypothetical protein
MKAAPVPTSSGTSYVSERDDEPHSATSYLPVKPTFCMGAYPERLQDHDVRGDMLEVRR